MALMVLSRLPTEDELDANEISLETFNEIWNENLIQGFIAKVEVVDGVVELGGYGIADADWFSVVQS